MHQSFLRYAGGRYFKWALLLILASIVLYVAFDPGEPRNGGTWAGYTLGTIAALLVLLLTWYGIRKRSYRSRLGEVQGWLSAHVYLGIALLFVATLHTGFQFGLNIHTLAYVLMVVVIASGVFGVIAYRRYPARITANRANQDRATLLREISVIDQRCRELADEIGAPISNMILSAIDLFEIGGGVWVQVTAQDRSAMLVPDGAGAAADWRRVANPQQSRLLASLVDALSRVGDQQQASCLQELIDQISHKRRLVGRLLDDIRMQGLLELWLYVHVPMTLALLAAMTAHVLSVFFYW